MNSPAASRLPRSGASASATAASASGPDEHARLDERHERRRRVLVDLDRRVLVLDRLEVGVRADGRRGGDHADPAAAGREGRGGRARPDDAEDRDVVAPPEVDEGDGRRGVAGDDDRLHVARRERVERLAAEGEDLGVGADAVWGAVVVAEVQGRFGRRPAEDLAEDRQPSHPRVEDPDGPRVGQVSASLRPVRDSPRATRPVGRCRG